MNADTIGIAVSAEVETADEEERVTPNHSRRERGHSIDVSIVIPFHNEEDSAGRILDECRKALDEMPSCRGEILAINDGSEDGTAAILSLAAQDDPRVRILSFRCNQGQAPALYFGLQQARGTVLVTLDGDGQNNPADIPRLLETLRSSGADLVSGVRVDRDDSLLRKMMSRLANRIRRAILKDGVTDSGCAIKAFNRSVASSLIPIRTLYSFIPALAAAAGHRIVECPVDHRPRIGGKSHYGLSVFLWRPAIDMLGVWWFSHRRFSETALSEPEDGGAGK